MEAVVPRAFLLTPYADRGWVRNMSVPSLEHPRNVPAIHDHRAAVAHSANGGPDPQDDSIT